jgi:hypothetical protein
MMHSSVTADKALLAAALRGAAGAGEDLVRALADLVWTACGRVTGGGADTARNLGNDLSCP